jgi:hypothetical protein
MKKLLLTGLFTLLFPVMVYSADVHVRWDANTESDLAGYKLYYGAVSRGEAVSPFSPAFTYDRIIDVGNVTTYTLTNIDEGYRLFVSATAYDTSNNESNFSNEINWVVDTTAPGIPKNIIIQPKKITIIIE